MLRPRKMPPFFKLTLVVLCAYILWTFNHPDPGYEGRMEVYPPNMVPPPGYAAVRGVPPQAQAPVAAAAPEPQQTFTFPDCAAGPSLNVAFLKTHKTGSSTMSNIMLRFAGK
jgi:hypothetical protein